MATIEADSILDTALGEYKFFVLIAPSTPAGKELLYERRPSVGSRASRGPSGLLFIRTDEHYSDQLVSRLLQLLEKRIHKVD